MLNKQNQWAKMLLTVIMLMMGVSITIAQDAAIPVTPQPDGQLCWSYTEAQLPNEETFEGFIDEIGMGNGIYTNYELVSPTIGLLGFGVYSSPDGGDISLKLQVYSPEERTQYIRYLLLINEKQFPIMLDGVETLFLDAVLEPQQLLSYSISLPILEAGTHDIVLLTLPDVQSPPDSTGRLGISSHRLTLVVGQPTPNLLDYQRPQAASNDSMEGGQLTLIIGEALTQWSYPEPKHVLASGQPLEFNVLAGYSGKTVADQNLPDPEISHFALLTFLDFVQVPIADNADVFYIEVDRDNNYSRIPIRLDLTGINVEIDHEVLVVRIDYPRIPMCILQGPMDGYFLNYEATYNRAAFGILPASE